MLTLDAAVRADARLADLARHGAHAVDAVERDPALRDARAGIADLGRRLADECGFVAHRLARFTEGGGALGPQAAQLNAFRIDAAITLEASLADRIGSASRALAHSRLATAIAELSLGADSIAAAGANREIPHVRPVAASPRAAVGAARRLDATRAGTLHMQGARGAGRERSRERALTRLQIARTEAWLMERQLYAAVPEVGIVRHDPRLNISEDLRRDEPGRPLGPLCRHTASLP